MASNKLILSWEEIETDCAKLAKKLKNKNIDLIVAITKGGLPPATILANKYLNNPPIITIQLKETVHGKKKAGYQASTVNIISPLNTFPIKDKSVLILDDVADSGQTLKKAIQLVKKRSPQAIITACLHYKPRSHTKPDIFVKQIDSDVWIAYPWE